MWGTIGQPCTYLICMVKEEIPPLHRIRSIACAIAFVSTSRPQATTCRVRDVWGKKKKDPYASMGKQSKIMPQLPGYQSFLLGRGGKSLHLKPC